MLNHHEILRNVCAGESHSWLDNCMYNTWKISHRRMNRSCTDYYSSTPYVLQQPHAVSRCVCVRVFLCSAWLSIRRWCTYICTQTLYVYIVKCEYIAHTSFSHLSLSLSLSLSFCSAAFLLILIHHGISTCEKHIVYFTRSTTVCVCENIAAKLNYISHECSHCARILRQCVIVIFGNIQNRNEKRKSDERVCVSVSNVICIWHILYAASTGCVTSLRCWMEWKKPNV